MLAARESGSQRSWILALLAFLLGIALYAYDDWSQKLPPWGQAALNDLEILIMAPGMAVLVFTLSELLRSRDERLRVRIEEEREKRFRFLGRIAASMAHEVRNPLHNIQLLGDELRVQAPQSVQDLVHSISDNVARLDQATMLIYELAKPPRRLDGDALGAVELAPVLDSVVDEVRRRHAGPTNVEMAPIATALQVGGRREGLHIILHNLIRNAVEAADGATVSIGCQHIGQSVEVRIHNPGTMPADTEAEESNSDVARPGGLGVGVSIARHLAVLCGGSLDYVQRPNEVVTVLRLQVPS